MANKIIRSIWVEFVMSELVLLNIVCRSGLPGCIFLPYSKVCVGFSGFKTGLALDREGRMGGGSWEI